MRSCLGRKFAQVEHVAVMMALFREHCMQPVLQVGEPIEQALKKIMNVVNDKDIVLLMQMLHLEKAILEWQKR